MEEEGRPGYPELSATDCFALLGRKLQEDAEPEELARLSAALRAEAERDDPYDAADRREFRVRAASAGVRHGQPFALCSPLLGGWVGLRPPEPDAPFWREHDGTRHSWGSLRCCFEPEIATDLREAHLGAIFRIAAAALEASLHGDQRESVRLAVAAGRLCEEIAGRWPPTAVEVPGH